MPATARRKSSGRDTSTSALVLLIGPDAYRLNLIGGRGLRLSKPDGTAYDIDVGARWPRCDCPDFLYRRDGVDPDGCKHIRALVREGLVPVPPGR